MPADHEEFLRRLLETFKVEAQEHLSAIFAGLVALEKAQGPEEQFPIIESCFRAAHSLKGAARAVNATSIEGACQQVESIFSALKRGEREVSTDLLDQLHDAVDEIRAMIAPSDAAAAKPEPVAIPPPAVTKEHRSYPAQTSERELTSAPPEERPLPQTVRVAATRLDSLLLQTEELLSAGQAIAQHAITIRQLNHALTQWQKRWNSTAHEIEAVTASLQRNGEAGKLETKRFLELVQWNREFMGAIMEDLTALQAPFERDRRALGSMVGALLEDMKKVVMLPFSSLHDVLAKIVRDIARDQGKQVEFHLDGGDVEVDRRILEQIKDPLIHLVRNSVDHGIETPQLREARGKSRRGSITLAITRPNSTRVEARVSDDGAGMAPEKLKAAAIEAGILSKDTAAALSAQDAVSLGFRSGVSTSAELTSISGRGLGLAIVEEHVEKLGGTVSVNSAPGEGTTFLLSLPLTLSTFRGVLVSARQQVFVVPVSHIERVLRVRVDEIKTVGNRQSIVHENEIISLVQLEQVLGLQQINAVRTGDDQIFTAFVLNLSGRRIAFAVDAIEQEQEVLLKNLGKQLKRVRNIAGATIVGAGKVIPVLNVLDLVKSASHMEGTLPSTAQPVSREKPSARKAILVVDDSITSRTLLKNILEANGYKVETAVDGVDGLTKLRSGEFALVVSDVEMPRMTGLDMTARIRGDKRVAETPVILVTALASQEDRERGIDVGANAYIVKTSFDQSNLLEAIRRLI